ncbi:MAG: bifunctional riboflavin kinase/FAD synthetase [Tissierellia bacterium]|nr:bifunctional riboflavin kinase/FAD synthetase [Tissierellia bacterium]
MMEIIDLRDSEGDLTGKAVALGNFDGIHVGHQQLIMSNIHEARKRNLKSAVLMFKNHTKELLLSNKESKLQLLTNFQQKIEIFKSFGLDAIYMIDFDESLMKLSPDEFIDNILIKSLNAKLITVGFDYRFGYRASGDSEYLKKSALNKGFYVSVIPPVHIGEEIVSSTAIRKFIRSGNIMKANEFLGRNYTIIGTVIEGKNRGRSLGFPTANIRLQDNYVIPKEGVYLTNTHLNNNKFISLTNIGYNPTFNENELKIETYILDFSGNLYGKTLEIQFIDYIRDDIKFNRVDELIHQIEEDVKHIKKYY